MASEEITNETAEQPVEAAASAPVAETPAAAVSAPEEIKKPEPRKDIFAELGLGGDDDKPKILKAKGSKNVSTGVVHVSSTFNNTVVTVTDQRGNVIGWSSAGKMGFKGSRKSTAYAGQVVCQDACRQAIAAGIDVLGENREQEMTKKLAEHAYDGAPLHFIGHLQRNKVKNVVGKVAMIESVGSLELLSAIDKQAEKLGIVQDILLEVNIGGEEAKSGFAPESLEQAAEEAKKCANVRVRGLMCIPPVAEGEHGSLPYFEKVHALFVDINAKLYDNTLDILSMGMSGDYEDAVRAGATMVRVGTAIFGARNYTI